MRGRALIMPRAAFICLLFVVTLIAPAHAIDDEDRASSLKEAGPSLCADHANTHAWPECKSGHVEALSRRIDSALETALRRLSKPAGVLLKRDQA
jgi:hypothetical protein